MVNQSDDRGFLSWVKGTEEKKAKAKNVAGAAPKAAQLEEEQTGSMSDNDVGTQMSKAGLEEESERTN